MVKCRVCGRQMQNIGITPKPLWHCPCEDADTQPITEPNFRLITPTEPLWRPVDWDIGDWGDCE